MEFPVAIYYKSYVNTLKPKQIFGKLNNVREMSVISTYSTRKSNNQDPITNSGKCK